MSTCEIFDLKRMSFGQLLRHFRVVRMLSIRELAKLANITRSHVSMLEHGKRKPRFRSLRGLSQALQLEGDEFGVFVSAATCHGPPDMKERPGSGDLLGEILAPEDDGQAPQFSRLNLPPVSHEEAAFLEAVTHPNCHGSLAVTDEHLSSPRITTPPDGIQATDSRACIKSWRPPPKPQTKKRRPDRHTRWDT